MSDGDMMALFGWSSIHMVLRYGKSAHSRALAAARKLKLGDKY